MEQVELNYYKFPMNLHRYVGTLDSRCATKNVQWYLGKWLLGLGAHRSESVEPTRRLYHLSGPEATFV